MIELRALNSTKGSKPEITINDSSPEERAKLAEHVDKLIKDGYAVFVEVGGETHRIEGYNASDNGWIVRADDRKDKKKHRNVPAKNTSASAVAPVSGG